MSTLLHWFTSPEWAQVVKALLHSLWQGALIALVLAIVLRRAGNPVARYRSSLTALAVLAFATVITWAIINAGAHHPMLSARPHAGPQPSTLNSIAVTEPDPHPETVVIMNRGAPAIHWTAWLAFAWFAGAILMLTRAGFKVAAAEQLRRSCRPLGDSRIEPLLAETRRALGIANRIRIGITDKLTSPAVVGVMVPMLIFPLALLTTLTPEQTRFVLLHELAHVRRRDYLANLFQFFAESLLFFNPAVWWISHQIHREREACCDALATELSGAPADYAKTLVHVAEQVLYPAPGAAPAFGSKREPSTLAERIQRLLVPGYRPSLRLTWRTMLGALILGGILLFSSALGTRLTVAAVLTNSPNTNQVVSAEQQKAQSASDSNWTNLETRIFNVDSNILYSLALEDGKPSIADTLVNFHQYILAPHSNDVPLLTIPAPGMFAGVMLDWPKGVLYNEVSGTLTVRATAAELTKIESALNKFTGTHEEQIQTAKLMQDGKLMFQIGKTDEAEAKLTEALNRDPNNQAALYYLSLVRQSRARAYEVPIVGDLPMPHPYARVGYTSPERQKIYQKLNNIRFDNIAFHDLELNEVVRELTEQSERRDPQHERLNFVISRAGPATAANAAGTVPGMPAFDPTTGAPIPLAQTDDVDLSTVRISLEPGLQNVRLMDVLDAIVKTADHPIKYSLLDYGIEFSLKGPEVPELFTRTFKVDTNMFYQAIQYTVPITRGNAPATGSSATAGPGATAQRGLRFVSSLDSASDLQTDVINFFEAIGVTLSPPKSAFFNDRQGTLTVHATADDLDLIEAAISTSTPSPKESHLPSNTSSNQTAQAPGQIDSRNDFAAAVQDGKLLFQLGKYDEAEAKFQQVLKSDPDNQSARYYLNVIKRLRTRNASSPDLYTRTFKLDPNAFCMGLQNLGLIMFPTPSVGSANASANHGPRSISAVVPSDLTPAIQTGFTNLFTSIGVTLSPSKSVFYNDRQTTLTVRATAADLNLIEAALNALNTAPPEVTVRARFIELSQDSDWQKKFDWYPKAVATNDHQTFSALLTDPQFTVVLNALEHRNGADLLNEGQVTTLSGRQAQFQIVDDAATPPHWAAGYSVNLTGTNTDITNRQGQTITGYNFQVDQTVRFVYDTNTEPAGVLLDVHPEITADESAIQLALVATVREFAGYSNSGPDLDGVRHMVPTYREAVFTNNCTLWDGQTVVFGGTMAGNTSRMKDKVPMLGDLPVVGRLFTSQSVQTQRQNLLIFVTPTLIDAAGNRLHPDSHHDTRKKTQAPTEEPFQPVAIQSVTPPSQQPSN